MKLYVFAHKYVLLLIVQFQSSQVQNWEAKQAFSALILYSVQAYANLFIVDILWI